MKISVFFYKNKSNFCNLSWLFDNLNDEVLGYQTAEKKRSGCLTIRMFVWTETFILHTFNGIDVIQNQTGGKMTMK